MNGFPIRIFPLIIPSYIRSPIRASRSDFKKKPENKFDGIETTSIDGYHILFSNIVKLNPCAKVVWKCFAYFTASNQQITQAIFNLAIFNLPNMSASEWLSDSVELLKTQACAGEWKTKRQRRRRKKMCTKHIHTEVSEIFKINKFSNFEERFHGIYDAIE